MDIHAAVLRYQLLQTVQAQVDLPAAFEEGAAGDVEIGGGVAQVDDAHIPLGQAGAAVVGRQHAGVGALTGGEDLQLEAGAAHHGAVALRRLLEHGAGQQRHLGWIAVLVAENVAHGVVKVVLAFLVRKEVAELVGQVVAQLLLRHGGHGQLAGKDLGGGQDHGGVGQGNAVVPGGLAEEVRHGVHGQDPAVSHHVVRQGGHGGLFQRTAGEVGQLDATAADINANDFFHKGILAFRYHRSTRAKLLHTCRRCIFE